MVEHPTNLQVENFHLDIDSALSAIFGKFKHSLMVSFLETVNDQHQNSLILNFVNMTKLSNVAKLNSLFNFDLYGRI